MPKTRVGVIYGGPSSEHDVSLASGLAICRNLDKSKYEILRVIIDRKGRWQVGRQSGLEEAAAIKLLKTKIDVAFLGLHGSFGEDGFLQGLLDSAKIKYTGSGAKASHLAFDKELAQKQYEHHGLPVPAWEILTSPNQEVSMSLPIVVKPTTEGSSVGVGIVKSRNELQAAVQQAFSHGERIMVQEYIDGIEVSCGVLEKPKLIALTPTELRPVKDDFFSYEAKYDIGGTEELTPPILPKEIIRSIQELAIHAHEVLGCRGYSRTDMFVSGNKIYVIETNTLPGFTPTSILPQQAEHDDISYAKLLDIIIERAKHD